MILTAGLVVSMEGDRNSRKSPALWVRVSAWGGSFLSEKKYSFGLAFTTVSCTLKLQTFDR